MPTASEAMAHVASLNTRTRRPLPEFVNQNVPPVHIYNIYNRQHIRHLGSLRTYVIPACKPGQEYSKPLVVKGVIADEYDLGDGMGNMGCNPLEGRKVVVDDIIGLKSYTPGLDLMTTNLEWWGVFAAHGEKPTKTELAWAKEKLVKFMTLLVNEGDRLYAQRNPNFQPIDIHREACNYLRLRREWNADPVQLVECPGCGTSVKPNVAKCSACGAILDREKAMELGLIPNEKNTAPAAPDTAR